MLRDRVQQGLRQLLNIRVVGCASGRQLFAGERLQILRRRVCLQDIDARAGLDVLALDEVFQAGVGVLDRLSRCVGQAGSRAGRQSCHDDGADGFHGYCLRSESG